MEELISDINNLEMTSYEFMMDDDNTKLLEIFNKYNNNQVKKFGWLWDCDESIYKNEIEKCEYDESILGIYIEFMDRGVSNWENFEKIFRNKFPNFKSLFINQKFGDKKIQKLDCDLIIIESSCMKFEFNNYNIINTKYFKDTEDTEDFLNDIILQIIEENKKIYVIINNDDDEKL